MVAVMNCLNFRVIICCNSNKDERFIKNKEGFVINYNVKNTIIIKAKYNRYSVLSYKTVVYTKYSQLACFI